MHEIGIETVSLDSTGYYMKVEVSNDLSVWTYVMDCNDSKTKDYLVPAQYRHYKYWRITNIGSSINWLPGAFKAPSSYTGKVLHFVNPPAAGSVITANYKSKCIAKDENNVFDLTIEMQLGEYTG